MAAEGVPLDAGYRSLSHETALSAYSDLQPCPVAEAAEDSVVWIRQSLLMADDEALADIGTRPERFGKRSPVAENARMPSRPNVVVFLPTSNAGTPPACTATHWT